MKSYFLLAFVLMGTAGIAQPLERRGTRYVCESGKPCVIVSMRPTVTQKPVMQNEYSCQPGYELWRHVPATHTWAYTGDPPIYAIKPDQFEHEEKVEPVTPPVDPNLYCKKKESK